MKPPAQTVLTISLVLVVAALVYVPWTYDLGPRISQPAGHAFLWSRPPREPGGELGVLMTLRRRQSPTAWYPVPGLRIDFGRLALELVAISVLTGASLAASGRIRR